MFDDHGIGIRGVNGLGSGWMTRQDDDDGFGSGMMKGGVILKSILIITCICVCMLYV